MCICFMLQCLGIYNAAQILSNKSCRNGTKTPIQPLTKKINKNKEFLTVGLRCPKNLSPLPRETVGIYISKSGYFRGRGVARRRLFVAITSHWFRVDGEFDSGVSPIMTLQSFALLSLRGSLRSPESLPERRKSGYLVPASTPTMRAPCRLHAAPSTARTCPLT